MSPPSPVFPGLCTRGSLPIGDEIAGLHRAQVFSQISQTPRQAASCPRWPLHSVCWEWKILTSGPRSIWQAALVSGPSLWESQEDEGWPLGVDAPPVAFDGSLIPLGGAARGSACALGPVRATPNPIDGCWSLHFLGWPSLTVAFLIDKCSIGYSPS